MDYFDDISFPYCGPVADGHKRLHVPLYHGIQYNHAGTLHLRIGDQEPKTYHGSWCFITSPATEFEYEIPAGEQHDYFAVCICGPRVERLVSSGLLSLEPKAVMIADAIRFREKLHELEQHHRRRRYDFCVPALEELLLLINDARNSGDTARPAKFYLAETLNALADRIRMQPQSDWDFDEEAAKLHVSLRHFRSLFKQAAGAPPQHFVLRERLALAANLLVSSNEAIRQIAFKTGFEDEFYFSRLFQKYYHLFPKEYRKEFSIRRH